MNIDVRLGQRKALWIVLVLNAALAVGFLVTGLAADSSSLIANGLDNVSDALVYALSLFAMGRSAVWKRGAARTSGFMLIGFAIGVAVDAGRRFVEGSDPLGTTMIVMAVVAAVVNVVCLWLIRRIEDPDVNIRAAGTFSANDFVANAGIVVGGALVLWLGANWPDLVVGIVVAGIAVKGGVEILRDAHQETHEDDRADAGSDDHSSTDPEEPAR